MRVWSAKNARKERAPRREGDCTCDRSGEHGLLALAMRCGAVRCGAVRLRLCWCSTSSPPRRARTPRPRSTSGAEGRGRPYNRPCNLSSTPPLRMSPKYPSRPHLSPERSRLCVSLDAHGKPRFQARTSIPCCSRRTNPSFSIWTTATVQQTDYKAAQSPLLYPIAC